MSNRDIAARTIILATMSEPRPTESPHAAPSDFATGASPAPAAPLTEAEAANQLTPEEQMRRFEAALKETDWGHQPC